MAVLVVLIVVGTAAVWLWWSGALEGLGDRIRDGMAVFYPSRPLSRRALPRKLLRAAARTVSVGVSGTALLPTRIEIAVNPADIDPFAEALDWLGQDVATALRKQAADKGWMVPDGPRVVIVPDPERPLRMPRATGRIGALRPDDVRTLERTGGVPEQLGSADAALDAPTAAPGWTGVQAGSVPTGYTGSAPTMAQGPPTAGAGSGPDRAGSAAGPRAEARATARAGAAGDQADGRRTDQARSTDAAVGDDLHRSPSPSGDRPGGGASRRAGAVAGGDPLPGSPGDVPGRGAAGRAGAVAGADAWPVGGGSAGAPTGGTAPVPAAGAAGRTAPTMAVGEGTVHLRLVSGQAAEGDLSAILTPAQAPLVLGRSRQCDLRVRDRHASGRHCTFSVDPADGSLTVEDLGSTNGTFVGGDRIRRTKVRPGATLRIGDSSWRVELDGITTADHPAVR